MAIGNRRSDAHFAACSTYTWYCANVVSLAFCIVCIWLSSNDTLVCAGHRDFVCPLFTPELFSSCSAAGNFQEAIAAQAQVSPTVDWLLK